MIRWAIVGCGDIAFKRVADAIQQDDNSDLRAACRRDETQLSAFCDRFHISSAYTRVEELLEHADVDAVYIATPVDLHHPQVIAAAAAGKHVLVEKPMALDASQCDEMIDACRSHQVKLSVAYYRRFYPIVHRMHQLINGGDIGHLMSMTAMTGNGRRFDRDDWRVVNSRGGGGPLMDIGSHRLDLFVDFCGAGAQVKALTGQVAADYEAEDCASVLLQFPSGVQGALQCYFGASHVPDMLSLVGTDGYLMTPDLNGGKLNVCNDHGERVELHPPHANLHAPLIEDFTRAILDDRHPTVTGEEGREVNRIIDLAYRSE